MKRVIHAVCLVLPACCAVSPVRGSDAEDKYAVVVHAKNNAVLNDQTIARIFLGKLKTFPGKSAAVPLMPKSTSAVGKAFLSRFLHKRPSQYKSYWMDMIFTGQGNPPKEYADDADIVKKIAEDRRAIGVVKLSSVTVRVRVVTTF